MTGPGVRRVRPDQLAAMEPVQIGRDDGQPFRVVASAASAAMEPVQIGRDDLHTK